MNSKNNLNISREKEKISYYYIFFIVIMVNTIKNIVYKVERVEGGGANEHYDIVKKMVNNKVVERKNIYSERNEK